MFDQLQSIFLAGKNLLSAIHDANIALVLWLTQTARISLAPEVLTIVDIGLLFIVAFGIVKVFVNSMKHAAIVAGAIIGAILLIPLF